MRRAVVVTGVVLAVLVAQAAVAGTTQGRFGLRLSGGQAWVNPSEYNDGMEGFEQYFQSLGAQTDLETLTQMQAFGLELRYGVTDELLLSVGYEGEKGTGKLLGTHPPEGDFLVTDEFMLTGYTGTIRYTIVKPEGVLDVYFLGGGGVYTVQWDTTGKGNWHPEWDEWDDSTESDPTTGYFGGMGVRYFLNERVSLDLEGIYRYLKIEDFYGLDVFDLTGVKALLGISFFL